jgi:ribonucleoside-diphosphate reductase alpha chain
MSKDWKRGEDFPLEMTEEGLSTLKKGYLYKDESPRDMYRRIAKTASELQGMPSIEEPLFEALFKQWVCPATPVLTNFGTDRGLPISCFSGSVVSDSIDSIMDNLKEVAVQSQLGGGTSIYVNNIRAKGSPISKGGKSDGVVPFLKMFESTISGISQGGVRRGSLAAYLDIDHGDFHEFISIRNPTGDSEIKCLTPAFNHGVCISDDFMIRLKAGDEEARLRWYKLLKTRLETGEPYIFFTGNVNRNTTETVLSSNLCSEIMLPSTEDKTAICCLSSMNLAKYDEWKDTDAPKLAIYLLDAVLTEFIRKAGGVRGMERSVKFAEEYRAVGLGALGLHTLLQSKNIPFESFQAMSLNAEIFTLLKKKTDLASLEIGKHYYKNSHRIAIAPTVSNSIISGGVSQGIEPISTNIFLQNSAKGAFLKKNSQLEKLLESKGKNTPDVWASINSNQGSVFHLNFLSDEEKKVFKTAREIDQRVIIQQAAQRQPFIDQGQSVNLFFTSDSPPSYINKVHLMAYNLGLKSLYYCRSLPAIQLGNAIDYSDEGCSSCGG